MCPERPEERSTLPAIDQCWDALTEEHLPIDPISADEEDWDRTQSSGVPASDSFKHTLLCSHVPVTPLLQGTFLPAKNGANVSLNCYTPRESHSEKKIMSHFFKMSHESQGCILVQNECKCFACECKVTGTPKIEIRGRDVLTCTHVYAAPSSTIRSAHLSITFRISAGCMRGRVMSDQGWKHMTLLKTKQENNTFG